MRTALALFALLLTWQLNRLSYRFNCAPLKYWRKCVNLLVFQGLTLPWQWRRFRAPPIKLAITIAMLIVALYVIWEQAMNSRYTPPESKNSANWVAGKFVNSEKKYQTHIKNIWEISKAYISAERKEPVPKQQVPVVGISREILLNENKDVVYRLTHSTMLMKIAGHFVLTDPVFSERASPFSWFGPKRFHQSPIALQALPEIDIVLISHDHYDHLDKKAIKQLHNKVGRFLTPLGVGKRLQGWGVPADKITELDWWQSYDFNDLKFHATPAQHFSGRGMFDRDKTLWASWVIAGPQARLFFSGDSGYFSGFKEIGERYGPFDLTMIETGAYNELWSEIHMLPEQSVQAHLDLQGKAMFPIHNSSFDLALHDWYEPLERALSAADRQGVKLLTPPMGEKVELQALTETLRWWRKPQALEANTGLSMAVEL